MKPSTRARRSAYPTVLALLASTALVAPLPALAQTGGGPPPNVAGPARPSPQTIQPSLPPAQPLPPPEPPPQAPLPNQSGVVSRIVVEGAERIEPDTIISYLPIAPGDTVDPARIDLGLKTLFRTDLFSDVRIELQGDVLFVRVVENPIINQVVFEGNSSLKDEKLRDELTIHPRGIFTRAAVQADVQRIVELYRRSGRISATVTPEIVELPQKRVDLIFKMNEGSKTGISRINFAGNKAFSDNTLRDEIVTTESHWYKLFTTNNNYDPDRIEFDREQLRKYYTNKGYYDFRIISSIAELSPDQKNFSITFTVDEGPRYRFGKLDVTTDLKRLNGQVLKALLPIKTGQVYQGDRIEGAVDSLTFAAGSQGFAFVDVRPRYTPNRTNNTVDVVFDVREGPRVYVERIDIIGNTRTLDPVIRQQLAIAEGDAYNRVLVDRSRLEIRRLDFFKTVDIEQLPGSAPDKTVLRVRVEEQPTGELSFGAGYSSVDKLLLDVGISERNFRGRGQDVRLRASVGSLRQQIDFGFTEPHFMGHDLRAGVDLYSYKYDYSDFSGFKTQTLGGGLRLGFPLNVTTFFATRYSLKSDKVTVANGACESGAVSQTICEQRGDAITSSVGYSVSYDKRNDPIKPTRGFLVTMSQDLAGLAGDVNYLKSEGSASWYYGITPTVIFQAIGTAGYIMPWGGDSIRINDRFYKGGQSFRGFETAGIGPRDTQFAEALGGKVYGIGTFELAFPNKLPDQYGIKTSLFTDFGTLGKLDKSIAARPNVVDNLGLRASAGLSVFWQSPMGPIRLDFSKILRKEPYDRTEKFRFTTATQF